MRLKEIAAAGLGIMCTLSLVGCGLSDSSQKENQASGNSSKKPITVVSREEGSGTRGAFIELLGIEEKDAAGNKIDKTTVTAVVSNSTETVMTTVSGDEYAIGYTSLGALNDSVKSLKIDGTEATAENIKNGTYKLQRPFNIAVKDKISDVAQDFINYIASTEGQKIVEDNSYIAIDVQKEFQSNGAAGKIVVAGSSSVTPVMEKLSEAYQAVNGKAEIEIQESDSTTGMAAVADGTCDIGMASRELKDTEKSAGLNSTVIALDGIAVIVNTENPLDELGADIVKNIFTGELTDWNDVK